MQIVYTEISLSSFPRRVELLEYVCGQFFGFWKYLRIN